MDVLTFVPPRVFPDSQTSGQQSLGQQFCEFTVIAISAVAVILAELFGGLRRLCQVG